MTITIENIKNSGISIFINLRKALTFNRILLLVIVFGITLRIVTFWTLPPLGDGCAYIAVGNSLANTGKFVAPWGGDFGTGNTTNLEYTRISPVYPSYLAAFYVIFGYSIEITQIAAFILAMITLLVIYLTTKNIFGHQKGLIVTAVISVTWPFIYFPGMEYGENMMLLFFVLTLWTLVKALKDSRYMILVGLFGAFLFLTKVHHLHFIFIIAPIIGLFIWRYYYMSWDVFKDKYYYFGAAIFLIITGGWLIRNNIRFAGSSGGTSLGYASSTFSIELLIMFIMKFLFVIILAAVCFLFWVPELRATLAKIKKEDYNALWVFFVGYLLLTWVITSLIWGEEIYKKDIVFRENHIRYIAPVFVSILWLVIKDHKWTHQGKKIRYFSKEMLVEVKKWLLRVFRDKKNLLYMGIVALVGFIVLIEIEFFMGMVLLFAIPTLTISSIRKKLAVMFLAFSIASVNTATQIKGLPHQKAGADLQEILNEGDIIMQDGEWQVPEKFHLYTYLAEYDIKVMEYDENLNATYIFSYKNRNYTGYEPIREYYWEGEHGIIIKLRNNILSLFSSKFKYEEPSPEERAPSAWLWKKI